MHRLFQFITSARLTLVDDTTQSRCVKSLQHKLLWCTICCLESAFNTCTPGIWFEGFSDHQRCTRQFSNILCPSHPQVFLTEPVEFSIVGLRSGDMTLSSALSMKSVPIIQKLACLDYFNLSHSSKQRRKMLFELSQPGNHPINWNTLLESLLKIFTEYTEILNTSADLILNPPQQVKSIYFY